MSSLSDFYGLSSSGADDEPAPEPQKDERGELASDKFDAQHDNSLVASRRALDSEMQTLVYENYAKFISATDTIRKMARNVDGMDDAMQRLRQNMDAISRTSRSIEGQVAGHRDEVDNLLGVSRLLKRLEFLFELPGRLRRSIELGDFEQAVRYYRISSNILQQYRHLKSFDDIRKESEDIIATLKDTLRKAVKEGQAASAPASFPIAVGSSGAPSSPPVPLSSDTQMSYTAMLILDLGDPSASGATEAEADAEARELMRVLVEQQRARFTAAMQRAVEAAAVSQRGGSAGTVGGVVAAGGRKGSMAAAGPSDRRGSVAERKAKEDSDTASPHSAPSLLSLLHQHFLNPFILFADSFLSALVRPYERKVHKMQAAAQAQEAASGGNAPGASSAASSLERANAASLAHLSKSLTLTRSSLVSLTRDLFGAYFTLVRKELFAMGSIPAQEDPSRVILAFTGGLKEFWSSLAKPLALVPQPEAALEERATELMQGAIMHCVSSVCDKVITQAVGVLDSLHTRVAAFDAKEVAAAGGATSLPSPQDVSLKLRKHVEDGVSLLVVLLSTREYLPEGLFPAGAFAGRAHEHFQKLLQSLIRMLAYRTPRRSEGPVYAPIPHTKLSQAIADKVAATPPGAAGPPSVLAQRTAAHPPLFYLYLSQISATQESRDIVASLKYLRKFFPLTHATTGGGARGGASSASSAEAFLNELMRETKENAQMLMLRFCETHGFMVTDIVRRHMAHLHRISVELALIFPKTRGSDADDAGHASSLRGGHIRGLSGKDGKPPTGVTSGRGVTGGINRDIQRLFTQKIATFAGVEGEGAGGVGGAQAPSVLINPDRTQPMWAVCKVAFKAMMEFGRTERLHVTSCHQLQLDVFALRQELPACLPELDADSSRVLNVLLEETINCALERTPQASLMDDYELSDLFDSSRAQRPSALLSPLSPRTHPGTPATDEMHSRTLMQTGKPEPAATATAAAAPSPQRDGEKATGALARLVLSSPGSNVPAAAHSLAPADLLQQLKGAGVGATR